MKNFFPGHEKLVGQFFRLFFFSMFLLLLSVQGSRALDSNILWGKWTSVDSSSQKISLEIFGDKVKAFKLNGKPVTNAELSTCYPTNGQHPFVSISWTDGQGDSMAESHLSCALGTNSKNETSLRGFLEVCTKVGESRADKCKHYAVELKLASHLQ